MLRYLFEYLDKIDFPGAGVFQYISFRSALTVMTALIISTIFGKQIIRFLQKKQIGETIRDLGLEGQKEKKGTPTMGGIIIIAAIVIPTLLFANLSNVYVILMLITTVWLGFIGFLDDYIKISKKEKKGLAGKFKILGQIILGCIIGLTMYLSNDIVVREKIKPEKNIITQENVKLDKQELSHNIKSTKTTIPFFKNNEFDYADIVFFLGKTKYKWAWLVLIVAVIFIVTAVSNGANLTDGLDGLASGSATIIVTTLGILASVSGNFIYANYLNIMYIPNSGELVVFASAFIGASIGFLWYNSYPAQIFMGDTGSLSIGGIIAVFAIMIRKELLIPILCGIFFMENISVIIQVFYFKHTKKKYGQGKRFYLMAPLHHHYQVKGIPESKIVTRFWIVGILLAVVTIMTLKIR